MLGPVLTAGSLFVALHGCGGDSPSNPPPSADGGTSTEDGQAPDQDGSVVSPDATKPSKVNVSKESISVAGTGRSYVLSVPKTYDPGRKYPLIVALHGDGGDADGFRVFLGLDEIAGDDAIMAYTDQVVDLYTPFDENPDHQLVEAVINEVKKKRSIDANKVWAVGYSKGGFVLNELACRKPGLFKAMAGHATGAPSVQPDQCPGIVGLPAMLTEGDNDRDIGAEYAASYWAQVNGCGSSRATTTAPCEAFAGCPKGKPVVYCLAPGVNHYPIWNRAAQVSWDFFKSL